MIEVLIGGAIIWALSRTIVAVLRYRRAAHGPARTAEHEHARALRELEEEDAELGRLERELTEKDGRDSDHGT